MKAQELSGSPESQSSAQDIKEAFHFKAIVRASKTWGDCHDLVKRATDEILQNFVLAVAQARLYFEIDMRTEFVFGMAVNEIAFRKKED